MIDAAQRRRRAADERGKPHLRPTDPADRRVVAAEHVSGLTPGQLRRRADLIESQECTGLTASWCPVHGDCSCPNREEAMDDEGCPLHSWESSHGAAMVGTS
jgi:hypothetical protein